MKRVRVLGDLWHGRVPEGAAYVGRSAPGLKRSPFANPFTLSERGADVLRLYAEHLDAHPELVERARRELEGKDLACWCKPGPCHADELIRRIAPGIELRAAFREGAAWWPGNFMGRWDPGDVILPISGVAAVAESWRRYPSEGPMTPSGPPETRGSWPPLYLGRAFVAGAKWLQYTATGWTMFSCEENEAANEAARRYPMAEGGA